MNISLQVCIVAWCTGGIDAGLIFVWADGPHTILCR